MKYIIVGILVFLMLGCKKTGERNVTYFGGQIINPETNYVLLLKDEKVLDTLLLDENNQFLKKISSLQEGLYTFKHGNEFQYIYLAPSDSVLVRLNTWDFDQSLVFSGKGSAKNEFLINLFLQNEKEENMMYQNFDLNEQDFQAKIDSLSNDRFAIYNDFFATEGTVPKGFKKLANIAIYFPLYRLKEIYPIFYKSVYNLEEFPEVSDSFYDFRNELSLNEENLVSFYPYQNYVVSYLYNISYQLKESDSIKNDLTVNMLNAINEHIKAESFKNLLLKRILINDFLKSESACHINEEALQLFLANCTNKEDVELVNNLVNDCKYIPLDEPLQDFEIVSYKNVSATINELIKNKDAVIYFWSAAYMSVDYLVSRIKFLENKYPHLLFIGINMQTSPQDLDLESSVKLRNIPNQYLLPKDSDAHKYLSSKYPRTILIDHLGMVKNGFINLDSKKLDSELEKLNLNE
ncbi:MAG TPA: hypothetical protein DER05_11290 [Lutibacter sp.]|nr:hypothetical protein [Lutibacter sp.]